MKEPDQIEPPQRQVEETLCCCVLINHLEDDSEHPCNIATSGPDDPFCRGCADRHTGESVVEAGAIEVIARMRVKEEA